MRRGRAGKYRGRPHGGHFQKSRSGDRSTIAAPGLVSLTAGSTVSRTRGAMQGPTPSRLQIAEPALADDGYQLADDGEQLADDSMASENGEYQYNDGQRDVSEDEENSENDEEDEDDEDGVEMGVEDEDLSARWGAQRSIGNEFLSSQPSILTITPGPTQASSRSISYPERRTPTPIQASQNCDTPAILSRLPAAINTFATPVLTQ